MSFRYRSDIPDNIIKQNILLLGYSIPKFYNLITVHNVILLLFQYYRVASDPLTKHGSYN